MKVNCPNCGKSASEETYFISGFDLFNETGIPVRTEYVIYRDSDGEALNRNNNFDFVTLDKVLFFKTIQEAKKYAKLIGLTKVRS